MNKIIKRLINANDNKNIKIKHMEQYPEYCDSRDYFKGVVGHIINYKELIKNMKSSIEIVNIKELYTDQKITKISNIKEMLQKNFDTTSAYAIYKDNKLILLDGNTRLIASILKGIEHVPITVYK